MTVATKPRDPYKKVSRIQINSIREEKANSSWVLICLIGLFRYKSQ